MFFFIFSFKEDKKEEERNKRKIIFIVENKLYIFVYLRVMRKFWLKRVLYEEKEVDFGGMRRGFFKEIFEMIFKDRWEIIYLEILDIKNMIV